MSMRVVSNQTAVLMQELNHLNAQQTRVTAQMASGSRLTSLGDDPAAVGQSAQITSALSGMDSFVQSASSVVNRMQAADSALSSVVSAVTSAISIAVQGSSPSMNAANMQAIAQQLSGIRDQVLSLANASYQGSYLFAGTAGSTQPFSVQADGSVSYSGDDKTQTVSTADGATFAASVSGAKVFGTGSAQDVFAALNNLIQMFSSGNTTNITDGIVNLRSAFDGITAGRAQLDAGINRISNASDAAASQKTSLQVAQAALVATDPAKLATELSAEETQRSALMSVIAVVQKGSLFDYL